MILAPFPDAEAVVIDILEPVAPGYTELPDGFLPDAIRVTRTGGSDDGITDYALVEVTSFGSSRARAWQMDGEVRQRVLAAGGTAINGVLVDQSRTATPSQQLPDPRDDVRVVTSSYRLAFRRPANN